MIETMTTEFRLQRVAVSWRGVALAAALFGICTFMHIVSKQYPLLTATGLPVLAQNIASLFLITLFGASCFSLGGLVIKHDSVHSLVDQFLLRSLCGFSIFTLLGYTIGMLQLLSHSIALAVITLPLLIFPQNILRDYTLRKADYVKLSGVGIILVWIFCFSGVLHTYILDDFSHYYPMQTVCGVSAQMIIETCSYATKQ